MIYTTYADVIRPAIKKEARVYDIVLVFGASIFIALCAQITIPVPFSPVSITGQTFAILLTGVLLGSKRGSLAVLVYITEGAFGIPVFAGAGFGVAHLFGPTGGYLFGFIPAAFICGFLAERGLDRYFFSAFFIMLIGSFIIFLCGLFWLAAFVGIANIFTMGLIPFITGTIIQMLLATVLVPGGWKLLGLRGK